MRPAVLSQTGVGSTSIHVTDIHAKPFNVSLGVGVSGTVNYTVQHTFDNPFQSGGPTNWSNHSTLAALATASDSNYAFPVRAIRLTVNSGTGVATLTITQSGGICA